ncbi:hypothetical protein [Saccharopolyspora hattusasensis]|uniref:hypothetical protein n=1 Tax=Saccharopolyspora hattusasensis TaxID=1128679 RepID=UPI003D950B1A
MQRNDFLGITLRDILPTKQFGRYLGILTAVNSGVAGVDTLLGGVITDTIDVRGIFGFTFVLKVIAVAVIAAWVPDSARTDTRMDWKGAALICLALLVLNAWLTARPRAGSPVAAGVPDGGRGAAGGVLAGGEGAERPAPAAAGAAQPRSAGPAADDVLHDGVDLGGPDVRAPNAGAERDGGLRHEQRKSDPNPRVWV